MKQVNRFKLAFGIWVLILLYMCFFSTSVYFNVVVFSISFFAIVYAFSHIFAKMNKREEKFMKSLITLLNN
jgi:4-hydroxybenzoate polyprenyltransferase